MSDIADKFSQLDTFSQKQIVCEFPEVFPECHNYAMSSAKTEAIDHFYVNWRKLVADTILIVFFVAGTYIGLPTLSRIYTDFVHLFSNIVR